MNFSVWQWISSEWYEFVAESMNLVRGWSFCHEFGTRLNSKIVLNRYYFIISFTASYQIHASLNQPRTKFMHWSPNSCTSQQIHSTVAKFIAVWPNSFAADSNQSKVVTVTQKWLTLIDCAFLLPLKHPDFRSQQVLCLNCVTAVLEPSTDSWVVQFKLLGAGCSL